MNYVVFDLEWNQCPQGKAKENPRIPFEVVEIGAIKLNENKEEIGTFHEVIRPLVYRKLHYRTREMIHITQEELNHARTFSPVIRDFLRWCGDDCKFVTWGSLYLVELQRNMDYYRIANPMPKPLFYYDLQKMFSLLYEDGKSRRSLEDAVAFLEMDRTRPFHRAYDDTWYTAQVMKQMDLTDVKKYESIDYYRLPKTREEEIFCDFGSYMKYVTRAFPTKEDAMADRGVNSMRCCKCGLPVWRRIRWFSVGSNMYLSLVQCPRHGFIKGKIRLKRAYDGGIFVVKTIKLADEESVRLIREKKESVKIRRKERRRKKKDRS